MIFLGTYKATASVFYAANYHDDTGTLADPATPTARIRNAAGTWSDLTTPAKQDGKTGHYGGTVDTTEYSAGQHVIRMEGTVATDKIVATDFCFTIETASNADLSTLLNDTPTVAEFEARSLVAADYTIVADLGTVQSGDNYPLLSTELADLIADIGANGAGLSAIPWNAAWDAEVESEVTDSIIAHNLDHLCLTATADADMTTELADNTILSRVIACGDTSTFEAVSDCIKSIATAVSNIAVTGAALVVVADGRTLTAGDEGATVYTSTRFINALYHTITVVGSTIDIEYLFTLPTAAGVPTKVDITAYLQEGPPAGGDSISIQAWDYNLGSWDVINPTGFVGITAAGPSSIKSHVLLPAHVDPADRKIRIRFYSVTLEAGTTFNVDQILVSYAEAVSASVALILEDTGTTLDALIQDIPTVAEFEARTIAAADYTKVADLGTVQSGDSYIIVNGAKGLVAIHDDRTLPAADYTIVGDLGTVQSADHTAAIADMPTVAEFNARTILSDDYLVTTDLAGLSTHDAADVITALGTGSTLTDCLTATGFSTHAAADVVTALGTGSTLTDCLTATGFTVVGDLAGLALANTALSNTVWTAEKAGFIDMAISDVAAGGGLDAEGVRLAIGLATANLDTQLDAIPTVTEFNARTLASADYLVETDTLARVTLVDTCTANADMRGTNSAAPAATALSNAIWTNTKAGYLDRAISTAEGNIRGADNDTLKTLSDQIDTLVTLGSGAITWTYTLTDADTGLPINEAIVWVTTDAAGLNTIASGQTNIAGIATFYLDPGTIYVWRSKSGYAFDNPDVEEVVG